MPIPQPRESESQDEFISRCMSDPEPMGKYPDEAQRYAVCKSIFDGHF